MKFALFDGHRIEAERGLSGICPACGAAVIAKCGALRAWHWAHKGRLHCDPWWERETEWHLGWKNTFPAEWQEIVSHAPDGERHIADVRTPHGRVVEFQHSAIDADERRAREAFYGPMVWVVDGLKRKRDLASFERTLYPHRRNQPIFGGYEVECALLRDWARRPVDVFFDFGAREDDVTGYGGPVLWHLHPNTQGRIILTPVPLAEFVAALHNGAAFRRVVFERTPTPAPRISVPLPGFQRYLRRLARSRRRF